MKHQFEIYILTDQLTAEHWTKLYETLFTHLGALNKFELTFCCTDNIVRVFLVCNKDVGTLSNNLEGILLRPVASDELRLPASWAGEHNVQLVAGGNLLDLKEKYGIKKSKDLQFAQFRVSSLSRQKAVVRASLYFKDAAGNWFKSNKLMTALPVAQLAIDFTANTRYLKRDLPQYLNIEKSLHMLSSENVAALFKVDTFPYFSRDHYLNLASFEFDKHSFIVGASGSGKSKLISLFVDRLWTTALKMNYRVVVIDPHNDLSEDFRYLEDKKVVNFSSESAQLFSGAATDITAATELTATLFKSLLDDVPSPKLDRVMRFSLFVLFTAQSMSLQTLKRFLSEVELRNQIIKHVEGYVPANIVHFFGAEFNEMRTKYHNEAVSPIIALIDEMQLQPTLVGEGELSLAKTIQENFLTVFSLNKVSMGERVVKTVAGLLIQQIFLLAQARAFTQKVILIIDEVSVVQNPALAQMLAEARKFNLSVILTQQYFGQIDKDLQAALFANVYNYYVFKVSEEDARALEGNLNIDLPKQVVEEGAKKGLSVQDMKVKLMTELHPRQCLVRVLANGRVVPAVVARTMDAPTASATAVLTSQLRAYRQEPAVLPAKFQEPSADRPSLDSVGRSHATQPKGIGSLALSKLDIKTDDAPPEAGAFNLSDILTQHSSSRLKLNKSRNRKDRR
jgi:hypothetical protein